MKKILFLLLLPVLVFGQSKNMNYLKTRVYSAPSTLPILSSDTLVNVNYYDGLGRTMQNISYKSGGAGQDIVVPIKYDDYTGRQSKQYLPYAKPQVGGNSLNYRDNDALIATQQAYYKVLYPTDVPSATPVTHSEVITEASPLGRVLEQAAPGDAWGKNAGHTIKKEYTTNSATVDKVYDFRVRFINNDTEQPQIYIETSTRNKQYYVSLSLYKTTIKDENWTAADGNNKTTVEYTDKLGRLLLKKVYNEGVAHDTYFVYDDFGNLTFVITPQAFAEPQFITSFIDNDFMTSYVIKQSVIDALCYTYKYDSRNRVVEKILPGKAAEYIIYDNLDRPVLTQDGNQKLLNKWLFTKYDKFNRVVYNGELTNAQTRVAMQGIVNSQTILSETKSSTVFSLNGAVVYYTKDVFPTTGFEVFSVNYYDNYTFARTGITIPTVTDYNVPVTTAIKSLPTGTMRRILTTTSWTTSAMCYDAKGRAVWTKTAQPYYNTYTTFQTNLDFIGKTLETKQNHIKSTVGATQNIEIIDQFSYSFANRLVSHMQKINNPLYAQIIGTNVYNERGQLIKKGIGGVYDSGGSPQNIDYKYNIRGWLTKINDPNNLGTDLFAEAISYNLPTSGTALYNGNISQVSWKTANDNQLRNYNYTFDALNRIKTGIFTNTSNTAQNNSFNLNSITYDRNGNITFLQRNGTSAQNDLDKMTYIYSGNQLQRISEAGIMASGFKTAISSTNTAVQYTYDVNGNLLTDANKNITITTYNHLNLPVRITFSTGAYLEYIYSADGAKIKKTYVNGSTTTVTEYNNGFVYEKAGSAAVMLRNIPNEEGYAYKNSDGTFNYAYQIKDHLNNVRISFSETDGNRFAISTAEIIEESNYDPFGLKHTGYNNVSIGTGDALGQKVEYNNREFEEGLSYNMNEMDWRHYDPAIGRFNCVDKLSEIAFRMSPYSFASNNPIIFSDPTGLIIQTGMHDSWGRDRYDEDGVFITPGARGEARAFNMFDFMDGKDGYGGIRGPVAEGNVPGLGGEGNPFSDLWNWLFGKNIIRTVEANQLLTDEEAKAAIAEEDAAAAIVNAVNNVSNDYTSIILGGVAAINEGNKRIFTSPTFSLMANKNTTFRPKYYPSGWIGGSRGLVKTYGVTWSIARGIGLYGIFMSLYNMSQGNISVIGGLTDLGFGVMGTFGDWRFVLASISYEAGKLYGPSRWYGNDNTKYFE